MATAEETTERIDTLKALLDTRIVVLDGAMGTYLESQRLSAGDYGGASYEGCYEHVNLIRPEIVTRIHEAYLEKGADVVQTNTFGASPIVLREYGLATKVRDINFEGARLARAVADRFTKPAQRRYVAGSMGPTTKAISVTGGVSFDELFETYRAQASALLEGGVDYLLLETCQDTRNIKAAVLGIQEAIKASRASVPLAVSATIERSGTMLAGQAVEALVASLSHLDLLYLGLNCATGPEFMTDHIRTLAAISPFRVACVPNAGLPDEKGNYLETPAMMAKVLSHFADSGWLNVVGGCCGTTPEHIAALGTVVRRKRPHRVAQLHRSMLSGIEALEVTDEIRPVIVGERTNVIGSRNFKELIVAGKLDEASEIAKAQVKSGAQVIDVCLANPDRNELEDMTRFLDVLVRKVKAPLMIDTTDDKVVEAALKYCQGKAVINSINLENGEEKFSKVVPVARRFGAALVVGTIDDHPEQGMAVTRTRKLEVAERAYSLLIHKYGVGAEDIYWDPLTFPCATGDKKYDGSAIETIEAIRLLKGRFPGTRALLGVSNVSFGLPPAARQVLNSVFLYHCVQAGLDLAIVNAQKLERYTSIPETERRLAEDLIFGRGDERISAFVTHFRDRKEVEKISSSLSLDERLARYVIEGSKDGLVDDLEAKLGDCSAIDIVNGPLMAGMDEVGRLFNANKLIVAEVLQSAEVMKAAVSFLEPHMQQTDSVLRGKVILATVKGDVHDIGKNLVDIILSNNGFKVIDLGIKVPPEQLISAIGEHKPDIVGLSGLLVKSAQQMAVTAADFAKVGIETPILVGGAALSEKFAVEKIADAYDGMVSYASDAMQGLELAKKIMDPVQLERLKGQLEERRKALQAESKPQGLPIEVRTRRTGDIEILSEVPHPTDLSRHVLINKTPLDEIWKFVNPMMLYGRHLGLRGELVRLLDEMKHSDSVSREVLEKYPKAYELWEAVQEVKDEYRETDYFRPAAVYRFVRACSESNQINFFDETGRQEIMTLQFARMNHEPFTCLSDYVHPDPAKGDNVALFAVTIGQRIRELSRELKQRGDFLKSHIVQALALESAEGYAELLHQQIRRIWGFPDTPQLTMLERFQGRYRGKRYSFGYPACPQLSDQTKLFELIHPEEIGIELTEGHMMDPEASVSALVFHHPQARYFSVGRAVSGGAR